MAVQLKHDIRGYHAGNISKRYLREAEAADGICFSKNHITQQPEMNLKKTRIP